MKWTAEKNSWHSGEGHRITKVGLEGDERRYCVYFNGSYLGAEDTFNEARLLAKTEKAKPESVRDEDSDGTPQMLKLTAEERAASRAKHRPVPAAAPPKREAVEWPAPKGPATTRSAPVKRGAISVGDLAKELGIDASDARAALRKAKVEKPAGGWSGDAKWAENIRNIIKKSLS